MKKVYFTFIASFIILLSYSQEGAPFKENKQFYIQGNSILIGNNILGDHATKPLMDISIPNDVVKMKYIDVDDDKTTFSSSEASIIDTSENKKIAYAALYWSGLYPSEKSSLRRSGNKMIHSGRGERDSLVNSILFKVPNGTYQAINGNIIYDSAKEEAFTENSPYVCYADVTEKLQRLEKLTGKYTVANVKATEGEILGGGSAGWLLYIIYEDITETLKYFTLYNGLVKINKEAVIINFKSFKSEDDKIFKTTIALGAMEGDRKLKTDQVHLLDKKTEVYKALSSENRKEKNFFNSSITIGNKFYTDRNPNSANTLGFDLLKMEIPNYKNEMLSDTTNQTKLKFKAKADRFYLFFVAFETEINKDFLEEIPVNLIVSSTEKKSNPVEKINNIVEKPKENIILERPIELSEEDEIIKELKIKSWSISGLNPGYYLITNVFSKAQNTAKWMQLLIEKNYTANSFKNPENNNWNYVYIENNRDLKLVYEKMKEYKDLEYFENIWIVGINL